MAQTRFVAFFKSMEKALDEHRDKGTKPGDPVYDKIYKQMTGDLAAAGVGPDKVEALAAECGHGATYLRLENLRKPALDGMADEQKLEQYSPEWLAALQRFLDAGKRLVADNYDREALAQLSESGQKLGWIVPIDKKLR